MNPVRSPMRLFIPLEVESLTGRVGRRSWRLTSNGVKKSDFGDVVEVVIILAILVAGLSYTAYGLFDQGSVSGSHNRYYEAREANFE